MAKDLYSTDFGTIPGDELFRLITDFVRVDQPREERPREGYLLDFKEDLSPRFLQSVAALANTFGGLLVVGVSEDDGRPERIVGVATAGELKTRVASMIASNLVPCPQFDIAECVLPTDGTRKLCAVKIREAQEVCLLVRKGERQPVYVRVEDQSSPADGFQMRALIDRKRQKASFESDLAERIKGLGAALYVTVRSQAQGALDDQPQRARDDRWLFQTTLCPHDQHKIPLDLASEQRFSGLIAKQNPGLEQLGQLSQATVEHKRLRDWYELRFVDVQHDYERRWRVTSAGDVGFITQVKWNITGVSDSAWSLYDLVADIARIASLARAFWPQIGFFGGFRLGAALKVAGLQHTPLPLFYGRMEGGGGFSLDVRPIVFAKTPFGGTAEAQMDLGYSDLSESLPDTVAQIVNQLLRCFEHTCDLQRLRQAVSHVIDAVVRE